MKSLLLLISILFCIAGCNAKEAVGSVRPLSASQADSTPSGAGTDLRQDIYESARKRNGGKDPSALDGFNEISRRAHEYIIGKDARPYRRVAKGAKPEIIIRDELIFINGKNIALGHSLKRWLSAIPEAPRCTSQKNELTLCIWDNLGIKIGTSTKHPNIAKFVDITLNVEPADPYFPDRPNVFAPKKAFPGYLELDGYGIDAQTKFYEIRANANQDRNIRCGSRDCSHPHGGFSKTASMYMRLNSTSDNGNLYTLQLGETED